MLLSLFASWEWKSVSPSFRAWNGSTFTHTHTHCTYQTSAHIATCIILNSTQRFKWFVLYSFLVVARVCVRKSVWVCMFVPFASLLYDCIRQLCHGMRPEYVWVYIQYRVHEYVSVVRATAIDVDITRFYIHIFCKTNENILMSSLNIT